MCVCGRGGTISFPSVSSGYGDDGAGVLQLESRIHLLQGAPQVDERCSSCFIRVRKRRFGQVRISLWGRPLKGSCSCSFVDRAPPRVWECNKAAHWFSRLSHGFPPGEATMVVQRASSSTQSNIIQPSQKQWQCCTVYRPSGSPDRRTELPLRSADIQTFHLTTADGAGHQSRLQSVELYFYFWNILNKLNSCHKMPHSFFFSHEGKIIKPFLSR